MRHLLLSGALLCALEAVPAQAYEDQLTVGVGAGYAHAASESLPRHGALVELSSSIGLGPIWSARGRVGYAHHPADEPLHVALAGAELLYLVDVLEFVPYLGAGLGALGRFRGDEQERADLTVQLVLGVDYLLSRELTLELDARPHLLVTDLPGDPVYLTVTLALLWMGDL